MPGKGTAGRLRMGGAAFELSLSSAALTRGLAQIEARVIQFGQRATVGFSRASAAVATFGRTLTRIGSLGFLGGRGPAGLITGAFAGAGAAAALTYPIRLAANIEIAAAQLAVFTGGFENARHILIDLQQFSAKAFIPPESLAENAALLLKYGVSAKEAIQSTKALATVSAGSSEELSKLSLAFAQVASTGHLTGEEVRQFKNTAFNPLVEIAARTGESFQMLRKRMEDGRISFAEVADALRRAVGPGGRFHGLLEAIAQTTTGKFRQAIAQIKLALIPLGDSVLPAITQGLTKVTHLLPSLTKILKENTVLYKQILLGTIAAAALGSAFVALGIAATLVANMLSLVSVVLGTITGTIAFLMTPVGVVTAGLGFMAVQFVRVTDAGQKMVRELTAAFGALGERFTQTVTGITDALNANDLQLAGRVMFAGLHVAWLEGTDALKQIWSDMLTEMVQRWDKAFKQIMASIERSKIWQDLQLGGHQMVTDIAKTLSSFREVLANIGTPFANAALSVQDFLGRLKIGAQQAFAGGPNTAQSKKMAAELQLHEMGIEGARRRIRESVLSEKALRSTLDQEQNKRIREAGDRLAEILQQKQSGLLQQFVDAFASDPQKLAAKRKDFEMRLEAAIREFDAAREAAADAARRARLPGGGLATAGRFPTGRIFDMIAQQAGAAFAGEKQKAAGGKGIATFDVRLIRQMAGAERIAERHFRVAQDQLRKLGIIAEAVGDGSFTFTTQP